MASDLKPAAARYWGDIFSDNGGDGIADDVWAERVRQLTKWGIQERPDGADAAQWKPAEDVARATYELALAAGQLTWLHILAEEVCEAFAEEDLEKQRVELVQVMAVAASWIHDLDTRLIPARKAALARAEAIRNPVAAVGAADMAAVSEAHKAAVARAEIRTPFSA